MPLALDTSSDSGSSRRCKSGSTGASGEEARTLPQRGLISSSSQSGESDAPRSRESPHNSDSDDSNSDSDRDVEPKSDSESDHDTDSVSKQDVKLRMRQRTMKAREAAVFKKAQRKLSQQACLKLPSHPAESYRQLIKADSSLNDKGLNTSHWFQRLRLLISYLKKWACTIVSFFTSKPRVNHILLTSIIDDTNMKLASQIPGSGSGSTKSRVVSVMNHVQNMVVNYDYDYDGDGGGGNDSESRSEIRRKHFKIHTPMVCLPKADTGTLATEFATRLFSFLGCTPSRFRGLGIPQNVLKSVQLQTICVCYDSLNKTNLAMFKQIRTAVHRRRTREGHEVGIRPFLGMQCQIHQLSLMRKPLLTGFPSFWSSVVRLAHLFEVHSFRAQFRSTLLLIVTESFSYTPVIQLPPQTAEWTQQWEEMLPADIENSRRWKRSARLKQHRALRAIANGDISGHMIVHYCTGVCCTGSGREAKARQALLVICKNLVLLFGSGFAVPLLYRWLHASEALQYLKDTWFAWQL